MLLVKAVFVLVTVVRIVQFATRVGQRGWHVLVPTLVRMTWAPVTFLVASAVLVLRPLMNLIGYHSDLAHVVLNPSHFLRFDNFRSRPACEWPLLVFNLRFTEILPMTANGRLPSSAAQQIGGIAQLGNVRMSA